MLAVGVWLALPALAGATGPAGVSPASLAFGNVPLGQTVTLPVTLHFDTGYALFSLSSGDGAFSPPWHVDNSGCSTTTDADCSLQVTFDASSFGPHTASFDAFECPIGGGSCRNIGTVSLSATTVKNATTTALTSSANPSRVNTPVTFTATVTAVSGSTAPTGSVTFADGTTTLATVALSGGVATFTTSTLSTGSHTITATYGGDTEHTDSSASLTQAVRLATSTTTLASSENPSLAGHAVTFTATVTGETGSAAPTGSVTFADGTTTLATVALSGGVATFTTSTLSTGSHTITATYGGDTEHVGSSATVTQVVQDAAALLAILGTDVTGAGPGTSLASKVHDATAYAAAGDTADACHTLDAFIREVRAQSGKKLTATQAARFVAEAQRTELALGC